MDSNSAELAGRTGVHAVECASGLGARYASTACSKRPASMAFLPRVKARSQSTGDARSVSAFSWLSDVTDLQTSSGVIPWGSPRARNCLIRTRSEPRALPACRCCVARSSGLTKVRTADAIDATSARILGTQAVGSATMVATDAAGVTEANTPSREWTWTSRRDGRRLAEVWR